MPYLRAHMAVYDDSILLQPDLDYIIDILSDWHLMNLAILMS